MAYVTSGLTATDASPQGTRFVYKSNDEFTAIVASGYFNSATNLFAKSDVILVVADADGTPDFGVAIVTSATGSATVTTSGTTVVTTS